MNVTIHLSLLVTKPYILWKSKLFNIGYDTDLLGLSNLTSEYKYDFRPWLIVT